MKKVQRKQINFGGTSQQYVRGDGDLGTVDNKVVVELSSNYTTIQDILAHQITCNTNIAKVVTAVENNQILEWRLCLGTTNIVKYPLLCDNISFNKTTQSGTITRTLVAKPYIFFITDNIILTITVTATYVVSNADPDSGMVSCSVNNTIDNFIMQPDWDIMWDGSKAFIKNKPYVPNAIYWGNTVTSASSLTKVVNIETPDIDFVDNSMLLLYIVLGGSTAGGDNILSIGGEEYKLWYRGDTVHSTGIIQEKDIVVLWCSNGYANIIAIDRSMETTNLVGLPSVTAADDGKTLKVVNGEWSVV